MEPLIALVGVTLALRIAGAAGVRRLHSWPVALRGGLATMFVLTGMAHFIGLRAELISMVPPALPNPGLLVTTTGLLELAGAVGLLLPRTVPWAAGGLTALLVGLFPANVYAALNGITTSPADALVPRTLMQLVFLAATVTVLASSLRGRRLRRRSAVASDSAQVVTPISAVTGMRGDADGQAWASRTSTLPSRTRVR